MTPSQIELYRTTIQECHANGTLSVLGGGGGGGGRKNSDGGYCGDGYGFSFYTTPKLILDEEGENPDDVGGYFREAEEICNGNPDETEDFSYDWTCVCDTVKVLAAEDEANGNGAAPEYIKVMDCDRTGSAPTEPPVELTTCIAAGTNIPCTDSTECCVGSTCEQFAPGNPARICRLTPRDTDREQLSIVSGMGGGSIGRDRGSP